LIWGVSNAAPIAWLDKGRTTDNLTNNSQKAIDTSNIIWNPIIAGSDVAVGKSNFKGKIEGIFEINNVSYNAVLSTTMLKVQNFTNRALGFLAIICTIYLVYQGVKLLINFEDEKAQGEALSSIKTVARVLGGVWLTWFIVSAIFYVVSLFA
jgi:hypothetical protein